MIRPLYKLTNFKNLKQEILDLISKVQPEDNQIICQGLDITSVEWFKGTGRIEELEIKEEKKYQYIHPHLTGTELEKIIKNHNGFRTRIMTMPPRQCYSIHADPTPRIHIPIVTNDQCWMIWPTKSKCFQLKEEIVFWTDTRIPHTFINGSKDEHRVHVVMCIDA